MSKRKTFLGILLVIFTFSLFFFINIIPTYFQEVSTKFEKEAEVNLEFLKEEKKPIVIAFFGYVGCPDICMPALAQIDKIYKRLDKNSVTFYFINLLDSVEPSSVDAYVKVFNDDFKGVFIEKTQLKELTKKLNVFYRPSLTNKDIIDHSGYLHLFVKNGENYKQKYVYTSSPLDVDFIIDDINKLQGEI